MIIHIRPIAVGETLRRLTAKCLCAVVKAKAAEFFQPHQFGDSCSSMEPRKLHTVCGHALINNGRMRVTCVCMCMCKCVSQCVQLQGMRNHVWERPMSLSSKISSKHHCQTNNGRK